MEASRYEQDHSLLCRKVIVRAIDRLKGAAEGEKRRIEFIIFWRAAVCAFGRNFFFFEADHRLGWESRNQNSEPVDFELTEALQA